MTWETFALACGLTLALALLLVSVGRLTYGWGFRKGLESRKLQVDRLLAIQRQFLARESMALAVAMRSAREVSSLREIVRDPGTLRRLEASLGSDLVKALADEVEKVSRLSRKRCLDQLVDDLCRLIQLDSYVQPDPGSDSILVSLSARLAAGALRVCQEDPS